jgi:long-chain acyl-CoA synthetase
VSPARSIVLTGATGFLGMEVLVRLLERTDRPVVALVRAADDAEAQARMDGVLATLFAPGHRPDPRRVRAVAADLERPGLGLPERGLDAVADAAGIVVHCAASVSFALPLDEARQINVAGTAEVLGLARRAQARGALDRVVHVSTAYVAGEREGRILESDGDLGQRHRNTYEQTKLEAEALVEAAALPVAILRPSIVVGDSRTGWTPAFNVIYWPLQAFARGMLSRVPADPDGRVDIVPVDVVADAIVELVTGPRRTDRFHVVAGDRAPSCHELATLAAGAFGRDTPAFVAPGTDPPAEDQAGVFLPYFRMRSVFDGGAGAALTPPAPPLASYFDTLMAYARDARWGRVPMARWERAAVPV